MTRRKRILWIIVAGVVLLGAGAAFSRNRNKGTPVLTAKVVTQDMPARIIARQSESSLWSGLTIVMKRSCADYRRARTRRSSS